jgi:hypothetical protein
MTELWEILVPASDNKKQEFTYAHHKAWDAYVKNITGGLTVMKTAKGQWVSPLSGIEYLDRVIPCRIACSEEQISEIIDFTLEHYNQEAVMAYRISSNVIIRNKNNYADYPKNHKNLLKPNDCLTCDKQQTKYCKEFCINALNT